MVIATKKPAVKKTESKAKAPAKTKAAAKPAAPAKAPVKAKAGSMASLKEMAKNLGVKGIAKMPKPELIHAIQVAEGYVACYGRIPDCLQMDCLFRADCLPEMGIHT